MTNFSDCQCQGDAGCSHHAELQIPPSLVKRDKPKDDDLCVVRVADGTYEILKYKGWGRSHHWKIASHDPRIVGAVCYAHWSWIATKINRDAESYSIDGYGVSVFLKQAEFDAACKNAEAWRLYGT